MSRLVKYRIVALSGLVILLGFMIWSFEKSSDRVQVADRYHARNRTGNFYARAANKPMKMNSGSSGSNPPSSRQGSTSKKRR